MKEFITKLNRIQCKLNAPKNQRNNFGNYNYRNCEDILEALKPLLLAEGLIVTITDEIQVVGDRVYVKATATITDGEHSQQTTALAREAIEKKGMDVSQLTGATSSYARKYALNGLFLIDDNKDADSMNNNQPQQQQQRQTQRQQAPQQKREPVVNPQQVQHLQGAIMAAGVTDEWFCQKSKIKSLGHLKAAKFEPAVNWLKEIAQGKQEDNTQAA
ncbi:ERF family protein [uncultured Endozoicomonas sp.]|uniref:ERF family protein n=1 Tax=uncultured Endozoicomonas sp. TaxID=432652 RepID=UPI002610F413|nr:ERF family protein [uncultured Endozoicomonas sp.]